MQTINDSDPTALRFRNPSLKSIQLQIEEETSVNSNITHSSEEVAFLGLEHGIDLRDNKGNIFGETGSVSVDDGWITVTTNQTYYNPVVIAGIPQHLDDDSGVVRIRNITPNSFDLRFQEWNYRDGGHTFEYVSYLVMEGSIPLDASSICESNNDRSNLPFNTILKHPNNETKASNFIISTREYVENFENCQEDRSLAGCDFDGDGKLNRTDSDGDNDGYIFICHTTDNG